MKEHVSDTLISAPIETKQSQRIVDKHFLGLQARDARQARSKMERFAHGQHTHQRVLLRHKAHPVAKCCIRGAATNQHAALHNHSGL